ncbi:MAG: metallophosphoesterase family protein [Cyclobacteriaceae bacterium]
MEKRFVITDIHGCFQTFRHLLEVILQPANNDHVYLLGDYINKGPQSKETIDYLITLNQNKNFHMLRGNHEQVLLDVIDHKTSVFEFYEKGGMPTMQSFGIQCPAELPERYILFFRNLPFYFELPDFWLVHAGLNMHISAPLSDTYAMLNIRNMFFNADFLQNKRVIHGHIPLRLNTIMKNVNNDNWNIYLDSGCVYPNRAGMGFLSALELNTLRFTCKECIDQVNI